MPTAPALARALLAVASVATLLLTSTTDIPVWLFLYELSTLTVLSAFTLEGRGYRRSYALMVLLMFSFTSTIMVITTL